MNKLIYNKQLVFFEENTRTGEVRELYPICRNAYWEVYASFSEEGIIYAVVGVDGERRLYEKIGGLSRKIIYYEPAGRDLIYHEIDAPSWHLLSLQGGKLRDITSVLVNRGEPMTLAVTLMEFKSPVLRVHARAPRFYEKDCYFKQTADGYEKISEEVAKELMS